MLPLYLRMFTFQQHMSPTRVLPPACTPRVDIISTLPFPISSWRDIITYSVSLSASFSYCTSSTLALPIATTFGPIPFHVCFPYLFLTGNFASFVLDFHTKSLVHTTSCLATCFICEISCTSSWYGSSNISVRPHAQFPHPSRGKGNGNSF